MVDFFHELEKNRNDFSFDKAKARDSPYNVDGVWFSGYKDWFTTLVEGCWQDHLQKEHESRKQSTNLLEAGTCPLSIRECR